MVAASGNFSPYQLVTLANAKYFVTEAVGFGISVNFPVAFNITMGGVMFSL
jgi:hypothetical protein